MVAVIAVSRAAGLRYNDSNSMAVGLWRVTVLDRAPAKGDLVTFCPPDMPAVRAGLERHYLTRGECAVGTEPLIKPVVAVPGDLVTVAPDGVSVNGRPEPNTVQLATDSAGRPLYPVPVGLYRVQFGEVWLLSGHSVRSWDSRYFGAVPVTSIQGKATPIWVTR